jgi:flavin reductase (DIM6/NTAB) family NADH-FMN oxidoreductase RutF
MKRSLGAQTIAYPTPTWVLCTYDARGRANAMTAAWGGICCSEPPCIGVSLRKSRHSYESIQQRKAFTVCMPSETHVREVDYLGLATGQEVDKFAVAGLTAVRSELVDAPYVAEFPVILECRLVRAVELGVHTQFIGQIIDVKVDESVLDGQGVPLVEKLKPIVFAPGSQTYHGLGPTIAQAFLAGKAIKERRPAPSLQ